MKRNLKGKIIKQNPQINVKQLKETQILIRNLRTYGIREKTYNIVPPFAHRPKLQRDQNSNTDRVF